jgi:hypothetical protein
MAKHKWKWKQRWLTCTDARPMLSYLRKHAKARASDRKLRLLAVACCRRFWHLLSHESSRLAVETSERYADGLATREELQTAANAALSRCNELGEEYERAVDIVEAGFAAGDADEDARQVAYDEALAPVRDPLNAAHAAVEVARDTRITPRLRLPNDLKEIENAALCGLTRDVFPNPFRPSPAIEPSVLKWRDATVVRLAAGAYESRLLPSGHLDTARLGILADALEDAGAFGTELLAHLRSPGPHLRGCWCLDLLLGKS